MNFTEAVQKHRQRNLLPEEEILAEQIAEYPVMERCMECGGKEWDWINGKCVDCGVSSRVWTPARRNLLSEAIVTLIAHDAGQPAPDAKDASRPWCEDHDRAILDCLLSLAREVVEHRVRARAIIGQLTDLTYQHNQVVAELRGGVA